MSLWFNYPSIIDAYTVVINSTAASLSFNASQPGIFHCVPFEHNVSSPVSRADLLNHARLDLLVIPPSLSATMEFVDLSPETHYDIYCSSTNIPGTSVMPFQETLSKKWNITTSCCQGIVIDDIPPYLMPYTGSPTIMPEFIFTARMNARHQQGVDFTASFQYMGCPWNASAYNLNTDISDKIDIYPHTLHFNPSTTVTNPSEEVVPFIIRSKIEGCFQVTLQQSIYSVTTKQYNSYSFFVPLLSYSKPVPGPRIKQVQYSYDARNVTIDFDVATDRGLSQLYLSQTVGGTFNCSVFFKFSSAPTSNCMWDSDTRVIVQTPISSEPVIVGTHAQINNFNKDRLIRTKCTPQPYNPCPPFRYTGNEANIVPITLPSLIVRPIVRIMATSRVSVCDNIVIDPTGSTGNGGRNWKEIVWFVSAVTAPDITGNGGGATVDASNLLDYLNKNVKSTANVINIPPGRFDADVIYGISLKLTNYVGAYSIESVVIQSSGYAATPQVVIQQPSSLRINRWESLDLQATATIPSCAGPIFLSDRLTYTWSLFQIIDSNQTISQQPTWQSMSIETPMANPMRFSLPGYFLNHSTAYVIQITAQYDIENNLFFTFGQDSLFIRVNYPVVYAAIEGGPQQTVTYAQPYSFDGSLSVDNLYPISTSSLSFLWNCMEYQPNYGTDCNVSPSKKSIQAFNAGNLRTNHQYIVSLMVTNSAGYRAYTSIQLKIVGSQNSRVNIVSELFNPNYLTPDDVMLDNQAFNDFTMRYNNDQKMVVLASVMAPNNVLGTWSCTYGCTASVGAMSTIASSNVHLPPGLNVFPMILYPGALPASGPDFTFSLYSSVANIAPTSASITISINTPPHGGSLIVGPYNGNAFATSYSMITRGWIDDSGDYPLQYRFSCYSLYPSLRYITKPLTSLAATSTYLSQGYGYRRYVISCYCEAYDRFQASSQSAVSAVTVGPGYSTQALSLSSNINFVNQLLTTAEWQRNTTSSFMLINSVSSTLNGVDCGQVPIKCSKLNRFDCSTTPQTCGACLSDSFVGPSGDSNVPCLPINALMQLQPNGQSCNVNSDCQSNYCDPSGLCDFPLKTCPSSCSNRGPCLFFDQLGYRVPSCSTMDPYCEARCQCNAGYGGADCLLTSGQLLVSQITRSGMCGRLKAAAQHQAPIDDEVVINRAYAVSNIFAGDLAQINKTAIVDCHALLLDTFAALVTEAPLTIEATTALLRMITILFKYQSIIENFPSIQPQIYSMIRYLSLQLQVTILPGEAPVQTIFPDRLRLNVMLTRKDHFAGEDLTIPQTPYEQAMGLPTTSLSVDTSQISFETNPIGVSIIEYPSTILAPIFGSVAVNTTIVEVDVTQFDAQSYLSIVRGAQVRRTRLPAIEDTLVWVIPLRHYTSIEYKAYQPSLVEVPCFQYLLYSYQVNQTCPGGATVTVDCPAFAKGYFNTTCPKYIMQPICMQYNGSNFVPSKSCAVVNYTSDGITCRCTMPINSTHSPLPLFESLSSNRRLFPAINNSVHMQWVPVGYSGSGVYAGGIVIHSAKVKMNFVAYPHFIATFDNYIFFASCVIIGFVVAVLVLLIGYDQFVKRYRGASKNGDATGGVGVQRGGNAATTKIVNRTIRSFYEELIPIEIHPQTSWPMKLALHIKRYHPLIEIATSVFNSGSEPKTSAGTQIKIRSRSIPEHWWDITRMVIIAVCLATVLVVYSFADDGTCESFQSAQTCLAPIPLGKQAVYIFAPSSSLANSCVWLEDYQACIFQDSTVLTNVPMIAVDLFILMAIMVTIYFLTTPLMPFQELLRNIRLASDYWYKYLRMKILAAPDSSATTAFTEVEEWQENSIKYAYDEFERCQSKRGKFLTAARLARMSAAIDSKLASQEIHPIVHELSKTPSTYLTKYHNEKLLRRSSGLVQNIPGLPFHRDNISNITLATTIYHQELLRGDADRDMGKRLNNRVLSRVQQARRHSTELLGQLLSMRGNDDLREKYLMTRFIIDCLPKYCQAAAQRMFSANIQMATVESKHSAGSMSTIMIGTSAALCQLAAFVVMIAFTLTTASTIGTRSFSVWLTVVLFLLVEALVFLPPLFAIVAFAIELPALMELSKVINLLTKQSRMIMVRTRGHLNKGDKNMIVQHLNVACRVARQRPDLPVARLILRINDGDLFFHNYQPIHHIQDRLAWLGRGLWHLSYRVLTSCPGVFQDILCQVVSSLLVTCLVIASHYLSFYITRIGVAFVVVVAFITAGLCALRSYLYSWYFETVVSNIKEKERDQSRNKIYSHDHFRLESEWVKDLEKLEKNLNGKKPKKASASRKRSNRLLGRGWVGMQLKFLFDVLRAYCRRMLCWCCLAKHAAIKDYSLSNAKDFDEFSDDEFNGFVGGSDRDSESSEDSFRLAKDSVAIKPRAVLAADETKDSNSNPLRDTASAHPTSENEDDEDKLIDLEDDMTPPLAANVAGIATDFHLAPMIGPPLQGAPMASYISLEGSQTRPDRLASPSIEFDESTATMVLNAVARDKSSLKVAFSSSIVDIDSSISRSQQSEPKQEGIDWNVKRFKEYQAKSAKRDPRYKNKPPVLCYSDEFDLYNYGHIPYRVYLPSQGNKNLISGPKKRLVLKRRDLAGLSFAGEFVDVNGLQRMIYSFDTSMIVTDKSYRKCNEKHNRAKKLRLKEFSATGPGYRMKPEMDLNRNPHTPLVMYMLFGEEEDGIPTGHIAMSGVDDIERLQPGGLWCNGQAIMSAATMAKSPKRRKPMDANIVSSIPIIAVPQARAEKPLNEAGVVPPPPPDEANPAAPTSVISALDDDISVGETITTAGESKAGSDKVPVDGKKKRYVPFVELNHDVIHSIDHYVNKKTDHKTYLEDPGGLMQAAAARGAGAVGARTGPGSGNSSVASVRSIPTVNARLTATSNGASDTAGF